MANRGLSMRKVREVLRLHHGAGLSGRAIARSLKLSPTTVKRYIGRAEEAGLSWPLPESLDDAQLERRAAPGGGVDAGRDPVPGARLERGSPRASPQGGDARTAVGGVQDGPSRGDAVQLVLQAVPGVDGEARRGDAPGAHRRGAGEKLFVDYAGHTVPIVDRQTGELREAQIFVAVLGASNYTYAEATWTQTLPDWIASHVRAFEFYGGCSELLIPDNLRSAVSRAHRYEPDTNPTYHDLACHYAVAVLPARVKKPRDKSLVS